jgi:hypothetical protein
MLTWDVMLLGLSGCGEEGCGYDVFLESTFEDTALCDVYGKVCADAKMRRKQNCFSRKICPSLWIDRKTHARRTCSLNDDVKKKFVVDHVSHRS